MVPYTYSYQDLREFFQENKSTAYEQTKKELMGKDDLFQIKQENFFTGFSFVISDGNVFEDISSHVVFITWLGCCADFKEFLLKESKEVICRFFRIILITPIFNVRRFVKDDTYTESPLNSQTILNKCIKDFVPSNESCLLDSDVLMNQFRALERELCEKWIERNTVADLVECYTENIKKIHSKISYMKVTFFEDRNQIALARILTDVVISLLKLSEPKYNRKRTEKYKTEAQSFVRFPFYESLKSNRFVKSWSSKIDILLKVENDDISLRVKNDSSEKKIALQVKNSSINKLLDFEKCSETPTCRALYKDFICQSIAAGMFPAFLFDGQQMLMFKLSEAEDLENCIDASGIMRPKLDYFSIKNIADHPRLHLKTNTLITPQMLLLLSLASDSLNVDVPSVLVEKFFKSPQEHIKMYKSLMDVCKDENHVLKRDTSSSKSTSDKRLAEERVSSLRLDTMKTSKLHVIGNNLPVIQKMERNFRGNKMFTFAVDAEAISKMLKIDLPVKSEKVVMKVSSIGVSEEYFNKHIRDASWNTSKFETFLSEVYRDDFLNEVAINRYLDEYNAQCVEQSELLRKPKLLDFGEIISFDYNGFYFLQEYLPFIDNKPTPRCSYKDAEHQLDILHSLSIAHNSVHPRNLCINEVDGKLWLIDFGGSELAEDNGNYTMESDYEELSQVYSKDY